MKSPLSSMCDNVPSSCDSVSQAVSLGPALQEEHLSISVLSVNDSASDLGAHGTVHSTLLLILQLQ